MKTVTIKYTKYKGNWSSSMEISDDMTDKDVDEWFKKYG
jgi:hypothetical protein